MPDFNLAVLIDHDLAPLVERYQGVAMMLRQDDLERDHILPFLDDLNVRFEALLLRLDASSTQEVQP
jgi:hypothetical protein